MNISLKMFIAVVFSLGTGSSQAEAILNLDTKVMSKNSIGDVLVNKHGDMTWIESNDYGHNTCFYFNKLTGVVEIDVNDEMKKNGYTPSYQGRYSFGREYLDEMGNVFLYVKHSRSQNAQDRHELCKFGIWNITDGFQLINVPGIEHVLDFKVSSDFIVVHGVDSDNNQKQKLVVLSAEGGCWPWQNPAKEEAPQEFPEPPKEYQEEAQETPITTPWDNLAIGKHGGRLNLLCQLLCNTKDKSEKKTLVLMVEAEASHVYDVLEYERRRAQAALDKAALEGKEDKQARENYDRAQNQITTLKGMVKKLSKTSSRIFSLDFPSKNWGSR